jgi:hypothetical protein
MPLGMLPLYLTIPLSAFLLLDTVPDLKGFLDYGATAALAAYMVWLWNKHTTRWQDKQMEIDAVHRAALERVIDAHTVLSNRLADRYDQQIDKLMQVIERNTAASARVADAIGKCEAGKRG